MALALFNTLTRRLEPFTPLAPPRVTLYTCGPTVWNYAHIGNFRTFLFEDLLRRHLKASGFGVFQVMNLTDVDDRIIREAAKAGQTIRDFTAPFVAAFHADREFLRIESAESYPRATDSIPGMIALIERLLASGVAYRADDGSVYFAIAKFPAYGRLSQLDKREIKVGARVASDEYAKDDPRDFALWKAADPDAERVGAAWDAPFGRGRPGWHLECSAMSLDAIARFGVRTLDIHCGGIDLIFPHHEDEIAQSEAATGHPFARAWMHGAFLSISGTKMSKRYGNILTARDLRDAGVDAAAVRLLFFQSHYRQPLDWTDDALAAAGEGVRRIGELRERLQRDGGRGTGDGDASELGTLAARLNAEVTAALDADLNAPQAVAALFEFVRAANRALDAGAQGATAAATALARVLAVLDVAPTPKAVDEALTAWVEERLAARAAARKSRDFKAADAIRRELRGRGVELEDGATGTTWKLL